MQITEFYAFSLRILQDAREFHTIISQYYKESYINRREEDELYNNVEEKR